MHNKILILFCLSLITYGRSFAQQVTTEMAQRVAQTFFAAQNKSDNSNISVLSWGNREQPTMYAISAPNRWVLIAGDRRVQPILAYSDEGKGTFPEIEDMPPAMLELLEWYSTQIDTLRNRNAESEFDSRWDIYVGNDVTAIRVLNTIVVDKLLVQNGIENEWGQCGNHDIQFNFNGYISKSYNKFCPYMSTDNCYALVGCTAIATAQIMWYWKWPYAALIYDDNSNQLLRNYHWDNIPSVIYDTTPIEQIDATATLLHDVGVSLNMTYDCNGSSASASNIITALQNEFYYNADSIRNRKYYTNSTWLNMLKSELNHLRPVCYGGYKSASKGLIGHRFVVDGYDSNNLFHFNFGHHGNNNGYYMLDSIAYNINQNMITNIQPSYPSCTAVTNPISFMLFTNPSSTLPNLVLQNGGAITLGSRTIASGKHISVISGDYVRLNSGLKVENGAYAYFDVQDMHCNDDLAEDILPSIDREQIPIKKNEKQEQIDTTSIPQKILRNGHILILRGECTYTTTGLKIE